MVNPIPLSTNLTNASVAVQDGFASSFGMFPVAFTVVVVAVVAVFVGSSVTRIQWVHDKLQAFSRSLYYTAVGLASTITVGVVIAPIYYVSQADGQTKTYAMYVIGALILAYVVFTGLGYVVDRVILSTWREYQETIEPEGTAND